MLNQAIKAAQKAGDFLKSSFRRNHTIRYKHKDGLTVVTEADTASEKIILDILQDAFAGHSFFSEEAGFIDNDSDYLWIIDPLDGTTNFSRNFGHFGVSIALRYQKKLLLGVLGNPLTGDIASAQMGKGAFLNGKPIHVATADDLKQSVVLLGRSSTAAEKKRFATVYSALCNHTRTFRALGSIAVDGIAAAKGDFEAIVMNGANLYDVAASAIIAQEAGASVTDFNGNPWDATKECSDFIVANPFLNKTLTSLLKDV